MNSVFVMQEHKENLIRDACHYITYQRHGVEDPECTKLLANPSLDTAKLISYDYDADMCGCPTCTRFDKILPIPAKMNEHGGISGGNPFLGC